MQIGFDYSIASGTYATGDLAVYIVDVTNGTVTQPSAYQIENVGVSSTGRLTFQTASNSTSYRLCFHVASTSASAYTVKLDNVSLGPQVVPLGAPVTDWVSYTPTGSWSTNTTYTGIWRRDGDTAEIQARLVLSGAPTAATLTVNLPSGMVIDTAKLASGTNQVALPNSWGSMRDDASYSGPLVAFYSSTTAVELRTSSSGSPIFYSAINATTPITWTTSDSLTITYRVPILGWSSSTVVSSSADTRVVAASMNRSGNQTGINPNSSFVKINFNNVLNSINTHGNADTTNFRINITVPGTYKVESSIFVASTNVLANYYGLVLYKNGSSVGNIDYKLMTATTDFALQGVYTLPLVAGDYLEIYLQGVGNNSVSTLTVAASSMTKFTATLLQGPSQIAASEVIAFRASNTAGTSYTGGAGFGDVPFATEAIDTHGGFATPTFTAPAPGLYEFFFNVYTGGVSMTTSQGFSARFVVTGLSSGNYDGYVDWGNASASKQFTLRGELLINMNAGDTIKVQCASDVTASLSTSAGRNYFQGKRLGGVM